MKEGKFEVKAIDLGANVLTKDVVKIKPKWYKKFYMEKFGRKGKMLEEISLEEMVDQMDKAGIEIALLIAPKIGPLGHPQTFHMPYKIVADAVNRYPDRFRGLAGVDPTEGMRGVREMEYAVKNLGFVGAHLYPHWFGLAPDAAKYYPFYAKCVELDVPIEMQVGQCLIYAEDYPLQSVGRPITLDAIACDFPELKLIGIHTGYPWTEEMISMAWKHPNVYIGSDAYAPKHWPEAFVNFINTWGKDKVIFGSDYPLLGFDRLRNEVEELHLRMESKIKFLRENAMRVFKL
jgi:predicted TIM-barrel fold metal-dependent hydrolase